MSEDLASELRSIATRLRDTAAEADDPSVADPLQRIMRAADELAKSWSGSNMGYQSRVYYAALVPPPPGAHFDSEWGFLGEFHGTTGDWREWDFDGIVKRVYELAEVDSLDGPATLAEKATLVFAETKPEVASVLAAFLTSHEDALVGKLRDEVDAVRVLSEDQAATALVGPIGSRMVRDTTAFNQGFMAAPHQVVEARAIAIRSAFQACTDLAHIAERGASHIDRLQTSQQARGQEPVAAGQNVFIGHGHSLLWRELKDFISDRLELPWDEFNRVPVAGVTNVARLSEMLDNAAVALVVLTAEDETRDEPERARQNAVHEAGLFQGRLGFTRAIVLLEEGCEEFSNIQGLGQIRFPAGQIDATFEEVRRVLEREGLIEA